MLRGHGPPHRRQVGRHEPELGSMTDDLSIPVGDVETAGSAEVSAPDAAGSPAAVGRNREAARAGTTVVRRRTVRRMVAPDVDASGRPPMRWNRIDAIV